MSEINSFTFGNIESSSESANFKNKKTNIEYILGRN